MAHADADSNRKRVFAHLWSLPPEFFEAACAPNAEQGHAPGQKAAAAAAVALQSQQGVDRTR